MSASVVRSDYEKLAEIAQVFREHADCNRQMLNRLQRQVAVLQDGDWVGKGAQAFYQEMDSLVWPSLKRLVSALQSAHQVTTQITQLMHQAEDDAAALFRLVGAEGSAVRAGVAAGIAAGATMPVTSSFGAAIATASPVSAATAAVGSATERAPLSIPYKFTGRESAKEVRRIAGRFGFHFPDTAEPKWDPKTRQWTFKEQELLAAAGQEINITEKSPVDPDVVTAKYADLLSFLDRLATDHPPPRGESPFPLGKFTQAEVLWLHANHPEWYQKLQDARADAWQRVQDALEKERQLARQRFGKMMDPVGDVAEALGWATLVIGGAGMALTVGAGMAGAGGGVGPLGGGAGGTLVGSTVPGTAVGVSEYSRRFLEYIASQIPDGKFISFAEFERIFQAARDRFPFVPTEWPRL